jgi:hypothetical protein
VSTGSRGVRFVDVPLEALAAALRGVGVPSWQADGLVEDYAHYARGEAAEVSPSDRLETSGDTYHSTLDCKSRRLQKDQRIFGPTSVRTRIS